MIFKLISDKIGANWDDAVNGFAADGRIGDSHLNVPGHDGKFGYGGTCFPKDINAFMSYCRNLDIDPKMLQAAWNKNLEVRKNSNWLQIDGAVSKKGDKNEL